MSRLSILQALTWKSANNHGLYRQTPPNCDIDLFHVPATQQAMADPEPTGRAGIKVVTVLLSYPGRSKVASPLWGRGKDRTIPHRPTLAWLLQTLPLP